MAFPFFGGQKNTEASATTSPTAVNSSQEELKRQLKERVSQELAIANATELVNKITENCFESCFPAPGKSVSSAEELCTKQCMQKYMHAWNIVSRAYIGRIQQQQR